MSDKPGRNSPCPCGSGLKFLKCCYLREEYPQEYFCEGPLLALAELYGRFPNIRTLSQRSIEGIRADKGTK